MASRTDPLNRTTTYEYDDLQRLTKVTDPAGGIYRFGYDLVGNRTSATDPNNRTTHYVYNDANELIQVIAALPGDITDYDYDAAGNLVAVTDPNQNKTQYIYDDADRLIQQIDPLLHSSFFGYDPAGNLTQLTDRNGRVRQFGYDVLDRQTSETWLDGSTPVNTIHWSYDAVGNLLSAGDNNSQYTFTHDLNDRLLTADNGGTPSLPNVILTYGYDAAGNNTSVSDNAGVTINSTYDQRDLLSNRTWSGGGIDPASFSQHFNAAWERTELDRFADVAGTQLVAKSLTTYDPAGRVATLTHQDALGSVLADYHYTYDLAGQLLGESHHGITFGYQYDLNGQLTSETRSDQPPVAHAYDSNGNPTDPGVVVVADNRIQEDAQFTYAYDNEGNLTQKVNVATGDVTTYTYDFRNRLTDVTITSSGGAILHSEQYGYDCFDRRIAITVNGVTTVTVYDGVNAWADYNAAGAVKARYLFGDMIDEIVARFRPGEGTSWYLADRLGSIRDLINVVGQVIDHIDYDAYGAILSESNAAAGDRFKFTGREFDAGTGLYYYRGRYYDPVLKRFISQDPLGFAAGDANLYRYIGNQPTGGTDPFGMDALCERVVEMESNLAGTAAQLAWGAAVQSTCDLLDLWAKDELSDPWSAAAQTYFNHLASSIGMAIATTAFGIIMGPFGGVLMSLTVPQMLITQVNFNYIGIYDAWQRLQATGDARLLFVRSFCATLNLAQTVVQLRLNLRRG